MPRPRTPLGTYGVIKTKKVSDGVFDASARYRREDGSYAVIMRRREGRTAQAAVDALKKALKELDGPQGAEYTPQMKVSELAAEFLADARINKLAEKSIQTYESTLSVHVTPRIGSMTLAELTPNRLQKLVAKIDKPGAAANVRRVLSSMLGLAVRNGALDANPMREVRTRRTRTKRADVFVPTDKLPEFITKLREHKKLREYQVAELLEFMAWTGIRVGEACALHWSDIDINAKTASIAATAVRVKGKGMVRQEHAKTAASTRTLTLSAHALAVLDRLDLTTGVVFAPVRGDYWDGVRVNKLLGDAAADLGFPELTTHGLRRSVATYLNAAGLSARDVADYLGHANPSMTQDVYMQRERTTSRAADALDRMTQNPE